MANTRYTEAEAEAKCLWFQGLLFLSLGVFWTNGFVYDWMEKIGAAKFWFAIYMLFFASFFGLMIYSLISSIKIGKLMGKRSPYGFQFKDEYTNALSNKAQIFSLGVTMLCLFVVMYGSKPKFNFFGWAEMPIHDFATAMLSIAWLSYSLPILLSYWEKDE